jgi:hypothetical protein
VEVFNKLQFIQTVLHSIKIKIMKKIMIIVLILFTMSCTVNKLTQKQVEINYELDKLWIEYKYKSDSLINEFYKN